MGRRIVLLTTGFPRWEGDLFGFFVAELAEELAARGHGVTVVAPADSRAVAREIKDGYTIRRVRYFWPAGWQRLAYGGGLVPNLRANPWLALLLPFFLAALGLRAALLARRADLFHGQWLVSGWLGRLTRLIHAKPVAVTLRGSDLALLSGLPRWLKRWLLGGFAALTVVSQEMRDELLALGLDPARVHLTPNGVNLGLFRPADQAACRLRAGLADGPLLVWAGRLAPEKGVADLIKALPALLARHPGLRLVLLGDGPLKESLAGLGRELKVETAVEFRPAVPRQDLAAWYNAADLVCLPSRREGRPNTLLEALACGRPVLATRVGGVPELIVDGVHGRLVPAGDPAALAQAGVDLLAERAGLAALGAAGPARLAELGLTWSRTAARLEEIYKGSLADQAIRPGPVGLTLMTAWSALVSGLFLVKYGRLLDSGYGLTEKLGREGWLALLARFVGW